ncbi:OmpH family outer membrane protein [Novosphingobium sp. APW14]|jgi:Skp family chaperone for outer membrane proteins|uniref:OmpH family outer membrane protein n=1 Tax=Novosphingobium sp. APW14 TaxID=3077237 RepID=UPI0028DDED39|nr:OmpH family outer membrane protein [Novosphingobium sp. APW14]MDT9012890.1 OmpH family outer membrane protein [Novosphingobium sp. APW14]
MKLIRNSALVAAISLAALSAQPASAEKKDKDNKNAAPAAAAPASNVVQGIGVANLQAAIANTDAYRVASQQRPVTYKPQLDQAQARGNALEAQIKPMVDRFNAARQAANTPALQQQLQTQARAIQELQEKGKQEIQQILLPAVLSEAFVNEQIEDKLDQAVQKAMEKSRVSLLLQPNAVLARANAYDLTEEIVAELNALLPTAQLVPPQGWEPREIREARAQQAAQQAGNRPAAAPAAPAGPQPEGR